MGFRVQLLLVALCISCHSMGANAKQSLPSKMGQAVWAKAGSFFEAVWTKPAQKVRTKLSGTSFGASGRKLTVLTPANIRTITQPVDLQAVMDAVKAGGSMAGLLKLLEQHAKIFQALSEPIARIINKELKASLFANLDSQTFDGIKGSIAPRSWVTTLYKCGMMKLDMGSAYNSVMSVMMNQMVEMMLAVHANLEADMKQWVKDNMESDMNKEGINTADVLSHISVQALLQSLKSGSFDQELGKQLAGAVGVATSVLKSKQKEQRGNSVDAFSNVPIDDMLADMSAKGLLQGLAKMMTSTDQKKIDQDPDGVQSMSDSMMQGFPIMSSLSPESRQKGVSATSSKRVMDTVIANSWDDMPQAVRLSITDVLEAVQDDLTNQIKKDWPEKEWLDMSVLNLAPFVAALKQEFRYSSTLDLTLGSQLGSMIESAGSTNKIDSEIENMINSMDDTKFDSSLIKMEDVVPVMKSQGFEKGVDKLLGQIVDVIRSDSSKIDTVQQEIHAFLESTVEGLYKDVPDAQWPKDEWLNWADKEHTFTCPSAGPGFLGAGGDEGSASVQATFAADTGNYQGASSGVVEGTTDANLAFSLRTKQFLLSVISLACVVTAGAIVL